MTALSTSPWLRWLTWRRALLIQVPLLAGAFVVMGVVFVSCIPARTAATAFVTALHEGRIDDARELATPALQFHLGLETPVATPPIDPPRTIAFIRAAQRVAIDEIVQSGFNDDFELFHCFDAKLDDAARFWIVVRKQHGRWLVDGLESQEPKDCEGGN